MKTYWTMRDGTLIDVNNMSVEHLRNSLKISINSRKRVEQQVKNREVEFKLNGDMAQFFNDNYPEDEDDLDEYILGL